MDKTPEILVRDEIRALSAYHVPESGGMVKLDAMENPFTLPPEMQADVGAIAANAALNRYPDPGARVLKEKLRATFAVPDSMELMLGNGSDELIQIVAMALAKPGAVLLSVAPSFVMFRMIATFAGMRYAEVPLTADFALDSESMLAAVRREKPALIFIAYPNNPTGNLFDADVLRAVIEAAPGAVVIDEAYHAFARQTFLQDLALFPNLLVMRTLSKLGLAGLRLGVLIGRPAWLGELDKLRLPYNVNVLTQNVASYLLDRAEVLEGQAATIRDERAKLIPQLNSFPGIRAYPSDANFVLFRIREAARVFAALKARKVLIKNLHGSHPALVDCLRVTVGSPHENALFVAELRDALTQLA